MIEYNVNVWKEIHDINILYKRAGFNCSLFASGGRELMDGSTINTTSGSVQCVTCKLFPDELQFLGYQFSDPDSIQETQQFLQDRSICFVAHGRTNLTAFVYNNVTGNDDITISFLIDQG